MLVLIRGAGDVATGIALRCHRCRMKVVMTDLPQPTAIRRTVCFSRVITDGEAVVEDVKAVRATSGEAAMDCIRQGLIPVLADPLCQCRETLKPDVLVDAVLAKRNLGTRITDAPVVIGVGPGFTAETDCHAVVETMRGHTMGRVIWQGSALPNTGIPGEIGGYAAERILRAPADGIFHPAAKIGDRVEKGQAAGYVDGQPMVCAIGGILRGILPDGIPVHRGMKSGDVDPRCRVEHCYSVSDKALAVGGGVVEACLALTGALAK